MNVNYRRVVLSTISKVIFTHSTTQYTNLDVEHPKESALSVDKSRYYLVETITFDEQSRNMSAESKF